MDRSCSENKGLFECNDVGVGKYLCSISDNYDWSILALPRTCRLSNTASMEDSHPERLRYSLSTEMSRTMTVWINGFRAVQGFFGPAPLERDCVRNGIHPGPTPSDSI